MLASLGDPPLDDPNFVYEPKYDGIRAIAEVDARAVRLWSRLGNEKTNQFPEIASALRQWGRKLKAPVILDGEIVALNEQGEPAGFQQLQGRIHIVDPSNQAASHANVAFVVFDLLRDGPKDLRDRPLIERRAALERLFNGAKLPAILRLSTVVRGDGRALLAQAKEHGWEGLIAKHAVSLYKSGKRTPDWRKIKLVHEQEFVIGGWTEPRKARSYFGALLLGVYAGSDLIYAGHTGTGFNERELAKLMKLLEPLATQTCPFKTAPKTNERPHWVQPKLVAQVKFTEWTADGKLRHPVYMGLRDDKRPEDVIREQGPRRNPEPANPRTPNPSSVNPRTANPRTANPRTANPRTSNPRTTARRTQDLRTGESQVPTDAERQKLVAELTELERSRRDGVLSLRDGQSLKVTNLHKVFWPKLKLTKGDLFRYYVQVAPFVLSAIADRPLVLKRFPNGVDAKPFYQHRAPDVPAGVRTEDVGTADKRQHVIGGSLLTLMYTTQLAAISQDPWFSRLPNPEFADCAAFDLDPSAGVSFEQVLNVARWIRDELATLGAIGVPKTSGADGLHIYIPLPEATPFEAGLLYCQIVATVVAHKHPKVATVERSVRSRGKRVYIDCFQNVQSKTLASAYSVRASEYAGVSTPLTWDEVEHGIDPHDFTLTTVPTRLSRVGDLWKPLRHSKGVDLSRVAREHS